MHHRRPYELVLGPLLTVFMDLAANLFSGENKAVLFYISREHGVSRNSSRAEDLNLLADRLMNWGTSQNTIEIQTLI